LIRFLFAAYVRALGHRKPHELHERTPT